MPGLNMYAYARDCATSISQVVEAYQAGERRVGVLALHATGATDFLVRQAESVNRLNEDVRVVFSDAPFAERLPHAVHLGVWATGTAAQIVGAVQLARAGIEAIRAGSPKAPEPMRPQYASSSGSAQWRNMGTNKAGTTFWGPDRPVWTDNADVMNAMSQHGPGIIIDGAHGTPTGKIIPQPSFVQDTQRFFGGQVQVLDINQLSRSAIQSLGGPGQNAYVNWCWGGFCRKILYALAAQ